MRRKWLIAILILAVVGIILAVVFINLFRDKDTRELSSNVHEYVENGYLDADGELATTIVDYLQTIAQVESSGLDLTEMHNQAQNSLDTYLAFETIGGFFDREIIFATYTNEYKDNFKYIANDLGKAENKAKQLVTYLNEHKVESGYWTSGTWEDCKWQVKDLIQFTTSAFSRLGVVYQASIRSDIMKNDLTEVIFDVVSNELQKVQKLFAEDNENLSATDGAVLKNFAETYLSVDGATKILRFKHNDDAKAKVKVILESKKNGEEYQNLSEYRLLLEGMI